MPRKPHQYNYIYKTTNLLNGRFYIGMHSTDDLSDGYLGSGTQLWRAIRKHGRENFRIEILEQHLDRKSLVAREKELVTPDFIKENKSLCMNLKPGGEGGGAFEFFDKSKLQDLAKRMHEICGADPEYLKRRSERSSKIMSQLYVEGKVKRFDWTGHSHKEETKNKIGIANSITQKGERNSQFGKIWINHPTLKQNLKISPNELHDYENQGWIKGRKMK
jgi:hypothetical protein